MPDYDNKFFENASSAELKQFRSTLNPEEMTEGQKEALMDLIIERTAEEKAVSIITKQRNAETSKALDAKAMRMWPELKDESSDFYKQVNEYMEQNGSDKKDSLANAANAVGLELGLSPANRRQPDGNPMSAIKGAEPNGSDDKIDGDAYIKKTADIASAYADLIDVNKEGVAERLAERSEEEV